MKKLQFIIALALVAIISSCSKDEVTTPIATPKSFDEIKQTDIQAKNSLLSNSDIKASDATGIKWENGTVVIFKTNTGTYGKFEVVNIEKANNYALIVNITLFNSDGTIKSTTNNLLIRGTYQCDLDIPIEGKSGLELDFYWTRPTALETSLSPTNGAKFLKYTF